MITPCLLYLLTKFSALPDMGNVLDYFPADAATGALAKAAFVADGEIRAVIVRRKLAAENDNSQNYVSLSHTLWVEVLRSYRGAASQRACDAALDALLTCFARDGALGGHIMDREPARLTESEPRFFYKFLCHYARIEVVVVTLPDQEV